MTFLHTFASKIEYKFIRKNITFTKKLIAFMSINRLILLPTVEEQINYFNILKRLAITTSVEKEMKKFTFT